MKWTIAALAAFSLCGAAGAQDAPKPETFEKHIVAFQAAPQPHMGVAVGDNVVMHYGGSIKGAPYAAESVTESIQALADGNRITNKQTSKIYRDSEGRTRMDNNLQPLGPWVPEGKTISMSMISDPVSGEHFTIDHARKTVMKGLMRSGAVFIGEGEKREIRAATKAVAVAAPPHDAIHAAPVAQMLWINEKVSRTKANLKTEQLGKRNIEGVECDGTKETHVIEAGQIGNDRPIEVVTERWFSPELKMDIYRKHSDPRFGENIYRVTNLIRSEQPRALFEPPSDYKLEEPGKGAQFMRLDRKQ